MPDFSLETECGEFVIGVDEVGRGPLAGPVVAAAVYIPRANWGHPVWSDVQDSKKLSSVRRDILFSVIQGQCQYGIAEASVEEIDELNILQATFLAMQRAVEILLTSIPVKTGIHEDIDSRFHGNAPMVIIDGNRLPKNWAWQSRAVIKGDSKSVSIAAASILAKVTRDRMMCELAKENPHFGWENNAGYGTPEHLSALDKHGITNHHRKTFAPVRDMLNAA
jgi:ribonuclease HII